jgi:hypothetical protein
MDGGLKSMLQKRKRLWVKLEIAQKIAKGKTDGKTTSSSKYLGPNPTTTMQSIHRQKTT